MKKTPQTEGISRRKFIKGFSGSVVGSTMLVHALPAMTGDNKPGGKPDHQGKLPLFMKVNGKPVNLLVEPATTLAEVLRNHLQLTGTKIVCNHGECGACTVLLDGKAIYSCHLLALDAAGKEITTIEGLLEGEKLHPIQQAFVERDGMQCGFCTPGQILAAQALLLKNPHPDPQQVKDAMAGNLCRCAAYPKIVDSVLAAAEKITKQQHKA